MMAIAKSTAPNEDMDAKSYWKSTEQMGLGYGGGVPHYADTVSSLISRLAPESVFEFGCNGGRNLDLVSKKSGLRALAGVDINESSVKYGIEQYGLNLRVGDEKTLSEYQDNSWDIVFTISVLDHIPEPMMTLTELKRITGCYLLLCEPYLCGAEGRIDGEDAEGDFSKVAPYSYYHDYYRMLEELSMTRLLDIVLPTGDRSVGMSYRLMLCTKKKQNRENTEALLGKLLATQH